MCDHTSSGLVSFVGLGPGAGDLITVRGARRIGEADMVLWPSGSVAVDVVREHARPDAELVDSARLSDEQLVLRYRAAAAGRSSLVRLVPGDAVWWTGLQPHLDSCRRLGLRVEVVPGVSPLSAVLAATGAGLSAPAVQFAQFDAARPELLASTGVVVVSASASRAEALAAQLSASGRPDDTPVVVAVKPGRADQVVLSTTLGELGRTVKERRLWLPALFLVDGSGPAGRARSAGTAGGPDSGGQARSAAVVHGRRPAAVAAPAAAARPEQTPPLHRPYRRRRRSNPGGAA